MGRLSCWVWALISRLSVVRFLMEIGIPQFAKICWWCYNFLRLLLLLVAVALLLVAMIKDATTMCHLQHFWQLFCECRISADVCCCIRYHTMLIVGLCFHDILVPSYCWWTLCLKPFYKDLGSILWWLLLSKAIKLSLVVDWAVLATGSTKCLGQILFTL